MRKFNLLMITFFGVMNLNAQITQLLRKEFEYGSADYISPIGKNGVLVYGVEDQDKSDNDLCRISHYDNQFNLVKSSQVEIPKRYVFSYASVNEDNSHLLAVFLRRSREFDVIDYDVVNNTMTKKTGTIDNDFMPDDFTLMGSHIYVKGAVKKVPKILIIDTRTATNTIIDLPGESAKSTQIVSLANDGKNAKMALFYNDLKDRERSLNLAFYNETGSLLGSPVKLAADAQHFPVDGSVTWLNDSEFIVSGTYGVKTGAASGIYFSKYTDFKLDFVTYNSFADFNNFFDFLSDKDQAKIERKIERIEEKGKEAIVKCNVEIHPIQVKNGEYLFIGEVYYPTYHEEKSYSTVNGKQTVTYKQVFDGYEYTHAVVAGFDKQGKLLYEDCFPIYLLTRPYKVIRNVKYSNPAETKETTLLYSNGSSIHSAVVNDGKITVKDLGKIETDKEGDEIKWTSWTKSDFWYDNNFIVYGTQKIKNEESEKKKRTVIFLSKMSATL